MTQVKAKTVLDEEAFVTEVAHLRQQGESLGTAVLKVYHSYELDEDLLFKATIDGLCRIAADRLGTEPRREILNSLEHGDRKISVKVRVLPMPDPEPIRVKVRIHPLREWPVFGVKARVLNECTLEEVIALEHHHEQTWRGVSERYFTIRSVRQMMQSRNVQSVADLSDEDLQRCLEQVQEELERHLEQGKEND